MKPKISVVVPIYGTEKYLRKCLNSIVNQTMSDIEIICVDDCSPDDSYKIVSEFQEKDSRVKYIKHEQNLGQGGARNTAIKASAADFIASVDSDDCMQLTMLEELWNASDDGNFDIVCCGYSKVSESGQIIGERKFKTEAVDNSKQVIDIFTFLNPAIWNKLWKKSLFIDNDIFFPNKLYYQDMATIPLLVAKAKQIKLINPCLYNYLIREGSVTTSYSSKHLIDYFKVYEILHEFLQKNDLLDRYSENLITYVNDGMRFHSNNVINSKMDESEKNQYLRHLLMLKSSFLQTYDMLLLKNNDELLLLLSSEKSVIDDHIKDKSKTIFGIIPTRGPKLNTIQKSGVFLFRVLLKPLITEKQMIKLKASPGLFFADSKNVLVRRYGLLFNLKR